MGVALYSSGANSTPGVFPDSKNNTESVFLPAGVTGNFLVKVKALNIGGDGIPGNSTPLDQDFTLVVSNGNETAVSVIQSTGFFISGENGVPANNSPDPGETQLHTSTTRGRFRQFHTVPLRCSPAGCSDRPLRATSSYGWRPWSRGILL
jgi:hypothetical protein